MATRLKVVCAWCGKTMHDGVEPVSHGICRPCLAIHFPEFLTLRFPGASMPRFFQREPDNNAILKLMNDITALCESSGLDSIRALAALNATALIFQALQSNPELSEDRMEQIALRSIFVDLCQGGLLKGVN